MPDVLEPIQLPVDIGVHQSESLPVANQVCTNLIPWVEETEGGSTRGFLTPGYGIESVVNPYAQQFKAFHKFSFDDKLYAVIGDRLYRVDSDDTATAVGTFTLSDSAVEPIVDDNGVNMAILFPGDSLWFYDTTAGLVQSTDAVVVGYEAETGGIQSLAFVNGVYVYLTKSTAFSGSPVTTNDGKDFDALHFVTPFLNDDCRLCLNARNELYIASEHRWKAYGSAATGAFPFVEIKGAGVDKGVLNRHSAAVFDNTIVFVGKGRDEQAAVWRITGAGAVRRISTNFIDSRINELDASDTGVNYAATYSFSLDGHYLFGFTVGTFLTGETYFYDATSSALKGRPTWHRRIGFSGTDWVVRRVAECYGRHYTGASSVGIGRISKAVYEDYGLPTTKVFSGYYLHSQNRPLFVGSLELVAETGVGNEWLSVNTTDREPAVTLEVSYDNGRTWKSMGTRHLGRYNEYKSRLIWHSLGLCETTALFRFTSTASVKQAYTKLLVYAEGGRN